MKRGKHLIGLAVCICLLIGIIAVLSGQEHSSKLLLMHPFSQDETKTFKQLEGSNVIVINMPSKSTNPVSLVWGKADLAGPVGGGTIVRKNGRLTLPDGVTILFPRGVFKLDERKGSQRTITIDLDLPAQTDVKQRAPQ